MVDGRFGIVDCRVIECGEVTAFQSPLLWRAEASFFADRSELILVIIQTIDEDTYRADTAAREYFLGMPEYHTSVCGVSIMVIFKDTKNIDHIGYDMGLPIINVR